MSPSELLPSCVPTNNCTVLVYHDSTTLQSFASMCQGDILITGRSGFSYAASFLCSRGIIMALPFWQSYDNVENVIIPDVPFDSKYTPQDLIKFATGSFDKDRLINMLRCLLQRRQLDGNYANPNFEDRRV